MDSIQMHEYDKVDDIKSLTNQYVNEEDTSMRIGICADDLRNPPEQECI